MTVSVFPVEKEALERLRTFVEKARSSPLVEAKRGRGGNVVAYTEEGIVVLFSNPPEPGERVRLLSYEERVSKRGRKYIKCFKWIAEHRLRELHLHLLVAEMEYAEKMRRNAMRTWLGRRERVVKKLASLYHAILPETAAHIAMRYFDFFVEVMDDFWVVGDAVSRDRATSLFPKDIKWKEERRYYLVGVEVKRGELDEFDFIPAWNGPATRWWSRRLLLVPLWLNVGSREAKSAERAVSEFCRRVEALGFYATAVEKHYDSFGAMFVNVAVFVPERGGDFFNLNNELWKLGRKLKEKDLTTKDRLEALFRALEGAMGG